MSTDKQLNILADKTWLGGCFLSHLNKQAILQVVHDWIQTGSKGHSITAINVTKLVAIQQDEKLSRVISNSTVNIADGAPIFAATWMVGNPIPERITGVDLMEDLLQQASDYAFRVYFFGSKQEVLDTVLEKCRRTYTGLVIAGSRNGYFELEQEKDIVADIAASKADILLIALGIPQKEYFVDDHLGNLNVSLALPVGGAFDVLAGSKVRAPQWAQNMGIEWLWRSLYDRSRAGLVSKSMLPFFRIVFRETVKQRFSKAGK